MELITLIRIARRFWLLILLPALIAGGLSLWFDLQQPPRYAATARLLITYPVIGAEDTIENWQMTEFLIDDLPQVLSSAAFAAKVEPLLAARNITLSTADIQQGLRMTPLHRAVDLRGEASSPAAAQALAEAAITVLQTDGLAFWGRAGTRLNVVVLDGVGDPQPIGSRRAIVFDAALRAALGLVAGFALAVVAAVLRPVKGERLWKSATM
ncbi:lipopolysaccharide biosynthesis protein [Chloroflexus islandicus]|uniref:Lipopolysaccharide biosynthesis protein n=1 Tax=Chloroflexus islandicus TaxID=1707952 RepID=A0A178MHS3_9CHLR|nr:lipopolysaccharide biosynthesis protein [Chloroflexus islandicus]OAN47564.1 lipopolysaccharide biosynthesis protein [Chloroflexus islandicus]